MLNKLRSYQNARLVETLREQKCERLYKAGTLEIKYVIYLAYLLSKAHCWGQSGSESTYRDFWIESVLLWYILSLGALEGYDQKRLKSFPLMSRA